MKRMQKLKENEKIALSPRQNVFVCEVNQQLEIGIIKNKQKINMAFHILKSLIQKIKHIK